MKHENGYWVKQLTNKKAEQLLKSLVSQRENKVFNKILKLTRTDDSISIVYASKRLNTYMTYTENNFKIKDYEISGSVLITNFVKFMIEEFGEEYASDFLEYATEVIKANPNAASSKRLLKTVTLVPDMVELAEEAQL